MSSKEAAAEGMQEKEKRENEGKDAYYYNHDANSILAIVRNDGPRENRSPRRHHPVSSPSYHVFKKIPGSLKF